MALSSIAAALDQYNAACPWHTSQANALSALAAIQYLLLQRAQDISDQGSQLRRESLLTEKAALEKFLGSTTPRSFGRPRELTAGFCGSGGVD
jgi:hypothetical protein